MLTAQRILCQEGNETLTKMLEAAFVDRRDPLQRGRLAAVAMNYFDHAFKLKAS